jgi:hypothetical protein
MCLKILMHPKKRQPDLNIDSKGLFLYAIPNLPDAGKRLQYNGKIATMTAIAKNQGLYDSGFEHDACGIGAVVNISGKKDHSIIEHGRGVLLNLHHRGAAGSDDVTGDGAGILVQIPHEFLSAEAKKLDFSLPQQGTYGVGMVFGSKDRRLRDRCDATNEPPA